VTVHAHDLYMDQSMIRRKLADARFVVTISELNRKILTGMIDRDVPITVVRCGIDIAQYPFRERQIPQHGPVRALCIASLQEYKGHRVLLEALAAGGPNVDRLQLDLIGDGELLGQLRELATELGISGRVRFLGSRDELYVSRSLQEADIFVLPSVVARSGQMEGLPVVLVEALASGVPSVSTALSGIPEILIDGVTGYLAQPANSHSLRDTLEVAIGDPAAATLRAKAGRELVERAFTLDKSVAELARLFRQSLNDDRNN
jgi:glycosyltransferase involved in cell wall biosynthesis